LPLPSRIPCFPPLLPLALGLVALGLAVAPAGRAQPRRQEADTATAALTILKASCVSCHGASQQGGGLRLDSRAALLKGGVGGAAAVPGRAKDSLLVKRVKGAHGGLPRMPLGFAPLTDAQVAALERWVDAGAPWPEGGTTSKHWAYVPPKRPAVPKVKNAAWVRNPIDAFVLARLEKEGLKPSPQADRVTLLRRLSLDLIGLPPTPAEVDAFLADTRPDAYERQVDRLLASPHYGERMALPWLDAARYADSNGFQQDGDNHQWVWRDWVVRALNANMPFDRFTVEQLAGDLLPNATLDQKIASGFNRNHLLNGEGGAIAEEQRHVILFDRVDVTATNWLGSTVACAQCHDHKYDPTTQRDYYRLLAFFNNVPESGVPSGGGQYRIADPWVYAGTPAQRATAAAREAEAAAAEARAKRLGTPEAQARAEAARRARDEYRATTPRAMVMSDARPRPTRLLARGDYRGATGEPLAPGVPDFLPPLWPAAGEDRTANRLDLAWWLVSPEHPLTARVQVNRHWQLFFGAGLVRTSEDFGLQGEKPSHPELLDWLAVEFRDGGGGWDVKRLHRLIVTSATYRQSSRGTPALRARDPENRLLARAARFRLPSPLLRDVALATGGLLDRRIGGKPVYPYQPKTIWDGLSITKERDFTYPQSTGRDLYRRSLYTFWRRTVAPANMFDTSARQTCVVRRPVTSTPLHALTTMNDPTWVEAGRALAERVLTEPKVSGDDARLVDAFRRVCARRPTPEEVAVLRRTLARARTAYRADPKAAASLLAVGASPRDTRLDAAEHAAWATVCHALFNLDEALTRE